MASVKLSVIVLPIVAIYLVSVAGFGNYSCHCDHSKEVSFFGITSKCSCTQDNQECSSHSCVCGGELTSEKVDNNDCCTLIYSVLDEDCAMSDAQLDFPLEESGYIYGELPLLSIYLITQTPAIKNFHALFRRHNTSILRVTSQLKL